MKIQGKEYNFLSQVRAEKGSDCVNRLQDKELEFAIFCIENVAIFLKRDAQDVYKMLTEESNILYDYIVPEYDMLHTQSKEYIVNDIIDFMKERGVIG